MASNPSQPSPFPRFWFRVDCMAPSNRFHQRSSGSFTWLPPRPRRSNVPIRGHTTGRWYEYHNWSTRHAQPFDPIRVVHYKTFSFYVNNQVLWIYPSDAFQNKVGDGSGNPKVDSNAETDEETESESSDEEHDNNDKRLEDWLPLQFRMPFAEDTTITSYATTRALSNTLFLQRPDQVPLRQLLPDRYLPPPDRRAAQQPFGGLVGELPILIALIAYSVTPDRVDQALRHCLRHNYQAHNFHRGDGWIDRRGIIVRVYHEQEARHGESTRAVVQQYAPAQKLTFLENGRYGKFVP